jgi:acyl-coenzyme A thioesterase PaaI-like protein
MNTNTDMPLVPADAPTLPADPILRRVLAALARNREPGYHFPGNFLQLSFDRVARDDSRTSVALGPQCTGADGRADTATIGVLSDLAMAACVRAEVVREVRLATVNMQLQLFTAPHAGSLDAVSRFEDMVAGRQGVASVALRSAGRLVGLGSAAFMVLDLPEGSLVPPMRPAEPGEPALLPDPANGLDAVEQAIYRRAEAALAKPSAEGGFVRSFWGIEARKTETGAAGTMEAGPHVGNRVGHVQGGLLVGFAEETARAALTAGDWAPTSISSTFLRPGEPPAVRGEAQIVHQGRSTAVVAVKLFNHDGRQALQALLTYATR